MFPYNSHPSTKAAKQWQVKRFNKISTQNACSSETKLVLSPDHPSVDKGGMEVFLRMLFRQFRGTTLLVDVSRLYTFLAGELNICFPILSYKKGDFKTIFILLGFFRKDHSQCTFKMFTSWNVFF